MRGRATPGGVRPLPPARVLAASTRVGTWALGLGALWVVALAVLASPASAQRWGRGWSRRAPMANPGEATEFGFTFCRIAYRSVRNEPLGQGWRTDYPNSDANFSLRFSQLTTSAVSRAKNGEPFYAVVTLEDDEIFQCPFVFMSDVGTVGFDAEEIERLRTYLLKGGFLYVDDFWGDRAWRHWEETMRQVLPDHFIQDVPSDHLLLNGLYEVRDVPQVPSIQYWYRDGAKRDLGAGFGQRRGALSRDLRRGRTGDGGDDPQHRHRGRLGAGGRGRGVLLPVFARVVRARHQHRAVCADALTEAPMCDMRRAASPLPRRLSPTSGGRP